MNWKDTIKELEKESRDSRVAAFKRRRLFRRRIERLGFNAALKQDRGVTSEVVRRIRGEIYRSECCAEYGLSDHDKAYYFEQYIQLHLPDRYAFLKPYGYEIGRLPY